MKNRKLLTGVIVFAFAATVAGCLVGCSGNSAAESNEPADLTGEWKQINNESETSWQEAIIDAETITVNWVNDGGDSKSLYWAGTYVAPTEPGSYSWDSVNDHEQTDWALLASPADTKTFTYEDGQLSYEVTALGTTTTVRMEKVAEASEG